MRCERGPDEDARDGVGRDRIFAESDLMAAAARVFAERRVEVLVVGAGAFDVEFEVLSVGARLIDVGVAAGCSLMKAKFGRRNTSLGLGGGVASWIEGNREEVASLGGVGARG